MLEISNTFRRLKAPETGRQAIQLTTGSGFCYPLYYFIPSITGDERYLIYHRAESGQVQLHRLEFATGTSVQLTHADAPDTHWWPWCVPSGRGVLDHRSVLNVARNHVIYFDGPVVHQVDVATLEDRVLFTLPEGREAIGQNCVTPDGQWFLYIHADQEKFAGLFGGDYGSYHQRRYSCTGTRLCAYHLESGEHRVLININSPIHHVLPYDDRHVVFCHPTAENGMLWTDLEGGWYTHLRTQDAAGGCVCHYVATERGLAYEVLGRSDGVFSGLYDPFTHQHIEFRLPDAFGYTHTGCDPQGRLWFYENHNRDTYVHDMHVLKQVLGNGETLWHKLIGDWPTFGGGQKSHFHPRLTPDRAWILMTGGNPETKTNHIFLLNVADLDDTTGVIL